MNTLATFIVSIIIALTVGGGVGYSQGKKSANAAVTAQLAKDLRAAWDASEQLQAQVDAANAQKVQDDQTIKRLGSRNADLARRLLNAPTAASVSHNSSEALAAEYEAAERDIGRCAGSVDRFSREAADASSAARTLDAAFPTRQDTRNRRLDTRAERHQRTTLE